MENKLARKNYGSVKELFSDYYQNKEWSGGKEETVSGSGSTLKKTRNIRGELPALFAKYHCKRILDAPCGDYNWFQHIQRDGITYIGGDIVSDLIADNNAKHQDQQTHFMYFDILADKPENIDVWICRDALLHFSFEHIRGFLSNFLDSGVPYLLASTYHKSPLNIDITTGAGRELNLEIEPFNLPAAIEYLDDYVAGDRPKKLALWRREDIAAAL